MNFGKFFAIIQMAGALCASVGYLCVGDFRRAIYWAAAAIITGSVTF
jgi:hypothetical protein